MPIQNSFSIRIMAEPEDIGSATNLMMTSLLGHPFNTKSSKDYESSRNPKYMGHTKVRRYITIKPKEQKSAQTAQWEGGLFDIEIEDVKREPSPPRRGGARRG